MLSMLILLVFLGVLFAVGASLWQEGLWSNAINLVNLVTAALLATNFFEPLSALLIEQSGYFRYFGDFISIWLIFSVALLVFSTATSGVSKYRVRFVKQIENLGGWLLALVNAWVMLCFVTMTLHMAPLTRNFFFGGFKPESRMFLGTAPDRQWLAFVQRQSQGPLSRFTSEDDPEDRYVFDPQALFLIKYASQRDAYAATDSFFGLSQY